jgi:hypothetical protein
MNLVPAPGSLPRKETRTSNRKSFPRSARLGTLGGSASANSINAFGQIAGASTVSAGSWNRAVLWDGSALINLTRDLHH